MSLHEAFSQLKFDKRMTSWNLNQRIVTRDEIKENLKHLEDVIDNTEPMILFPNPSPSEPEEQDSQQEEPVSNKEDHSQNTDIVTNIQEGSSGTNQKLASHSNAKVMMDTNNNTTTATTDKEAATNKAQHTDEDSSNPWW